MKIHTLTRQQLLKTTPDKTFSFFSNPYHLEDITPPRYKLRVLTPRPLELSVGKTVDYTVNFFGMPIRWTSIISEFTPPHRLTEVQLRGLFAFWDHTYNFAPQGNGTVLTEIVNYAMPLGILGAMAHRYFIKHQLNYIFDYRYSRLGHYFKEA